MASARRHAPPCQSSDDDARAVFRNELTACLALTAPVGMTEEGRRDWLAVAWDTLKHLPPDVLESGARQARQKCDHPSKIVPTIIAETAQMMQWLRDAERYRVEEARRLPPPAADLCTPEQAKQIMAEYGLKRSPLGEPS
jgi:hypothetical protein